MTWEIVAGIITLAGGLIAIGKIIANNTKALTEVKCSTDSLNETVRAISEDLKSVKDTVGKHETRISLLEKSEYYAVE